MYYNYVFQKPFCRFANRSFGLATESSASLITNYNPVSCNQPIYSNQHISNSSYKDNSAVSSWVIAMYFLSHVSINFQSNANYVDIDQIYTLVQDSNSALRESSYNRTNSPIYQNTTKSSMIPNQESNAIYSNTNFERYMTIFW